jgi:hypothetical protein
MTTASLDELKDECIQWLKSNNCNATKVSEIIEKKEPFVYDAIDKAIKKANTKAISRAANVQKSTEQHVTNDSPRTKSSLIKF